MVVYVETVYNDAFSFVIEADNDFDLDRIGKISIETDTHLFNWLSKYSDFVDYFDWCESQGYDSCSVEFIRL